MTYRSWRWALGTLALLCTTTAQAQSSTQLLGSPVASANTPDYRRAEQFLGWNTATMVAGDAVNPVWLDDGNRFWYRNKIQAGAEFILVDPVANVKRPVFDHARLAAAMSIAKETRYEQHNLPINALN